MKLYMFRTVRLSIIRSLFTVHSSVVYVIQVCRKLTSEQWINSWWWTDELSETCRFSWQNKFVKLLHLVGFIIKKFVTMHGHMSRCTVTCHDAWSRHDAWSHVTMHGHVSRCTVTCHDAWSSRRMVTCHDAWSHVTMHGHMSRCTITSRCTVTHT